MEEESSGVILNYKMSLKTQFHLGINLCLYLAISLCFISPTNHTNFTIFNSQVYSELTCRFQSTCTRLKSVNDSVGFLLLYLYLGCKGTDSPFTKVLQRGMGYLWRLITVITVISMVVDMHRIGTVKPFPTKKHYTKTSIRNINSHEYKDNLTFISYCTTSLDIPFT